MFRWISVRKMSGIAHQLKQVQDAIKIAASKRPQHLQYVDPRLVAVSKTKGIDMIIEAYDAGQRHFGENYVVELHEKANDIELQDRCEDIKWHYIGHLQRNKVSKIIDVPNLYVIETIDSEKLAKTLNDSWAKLNKSEPLNVMAQCNTSSEKNKSGCTPDEMVSLVKFITEKCPKLHLLGLMTIGAFDHDYSKGPNPDFQSLVSVREDVCKALDIPVENLELSMGMSADYEQAIEMGSSNLRVGSTIFGARSGKNSQSTEAQSDSLVKESTQQMKNTFIS